MPVDWPYPKSFQTQLEDVLNGTDTQTGPFKPSPTANPPPREKFEEQPLAKRPKLSHPLPARPPSHPLPPRPPLAAAVRTSQVEQGALDLAPNVEQVNVQQIDARPPTTASYVSKSTQTEPTLIRTKRQPLPRGSPAAPLPPHFYRRARAALPNSRELPGKKCPAGIGRYSAMPPPAISGDELRSLTTDLSTPQEMDNFVEGTQWAFPPPCKDWEKAVGYERPTKAQLEAEHQEFLKAQALADAQEPEEAEPRIPPALQRIIKFQAVEEGIEKEIEMEIGDFGFRQIVKWNWVPGVGLGPRGRGRPRPVNTLNAPKVNDELPADAYFKLPLLSDEDN